MLPAPSTSMSEARLETALKTDSTLPAASYFVTPPWNGTTKMFPVPSAASGDPPFDIVMSFSQRTAPVARSRLVTLPACEWLKTIGRRAQRSCANARTSAPRGAMHSFLPDSRRAPELTAARGNVFALSNCHDRRDPTQSADNGPASSGLGGGDHRAAAVALLAVGENRAVLLLHLLFSLVVLHFCRGFCGLQIARCVASAGSSEGDPVSLSLVGAAVAVVRGGEPAHSELVLRDGAVVLFMGLAVSPPRLWHR